MQSSLPHPLAAGLLRSQTPLSLARHLPTLWGVTLPEGAKSAGDEPLLCALRIAQRKKKVQTRAMRGSAQSFIGKKPYLNLRLRAASDFFLRLTDGFS